MTTTPKWIHDADIRFTAPSRNVDVIFLHCSASDQPSHDDVAVIKHWHVHANGWSDVGYHFFINKNGNIQTGRSLESIPAAQEGHNTNSIAICLHGLKKSAFTQKQYQSVKRLCKAITDAYSKSIRIRGHCEVSSKACPVFDYQSVLNLDSEGLYKKTQAAQNTKDNSTSNAPAPPTTISKHSSLAGRRYPVFSLFDQGQMISALQNLLNTFGVQCAPDGLFGKGTEEAIKRFQRRHCLKADGIAGPKTVGAMMGDSPFLKKPAQGPSVRALQLLLALHGEQLTIDGIFGSGTEQALKAVQRREGIKADGIYGPNTHAALT